METPKTNPTATSGIPHPPLKEVAAKIESSQRAAPKFVME